MCLYTNRLKPLVADRNLIVCKSLTIRFFGEGIITPFQHHKIRFNSFISSKKAIIDYNEISGYHQITDEGVHAYTHVDDILSYEAIIPKGTPFWVSDDLSQIAATKMYITDKIATKNTDLNYICDLLLKENFVKIKKDEISVIDKYQISWEFIGKYMSYYMTDYLNIDLFDSPSLQEIFKYRLYINALLPENLIIPNDVWFWSKGGMGVNVDGRITDCLNTNDCWNCKVLARSKI